MLAPPGTPLGTDAVRAVAIGASTVTEVAEAAVQRLHEVDGELRAFRVVDEALVGRQAKELDATPGGAARGLLVGVKDVIDTADLPTGYGSELFEGNQPAADAAAVTRLRGAGALVLGKTESTEFAMFRPTRTRNPVDPERTPGGSSSGSAAAVAAGIVPVALGTQTAGSVVRPAAYCGVYGWKPARGWTATDGVWRLGRSLDTVGLFARRACDLALLYGVLADRTPTSPLGGTKRVGILRAREWAEADGDVHAALDTVADRLRRAGWSVDEVRMPDVWRDLPEHQAVVMAAEVAHNLRSVLGERVVQISAAAFAIVERGDATPAPSYLDSLRAAEEALDVLPALAGSVDVLLAPSATGVAPLGLGATGDPVFCRAWTLLGLPAANVPAVRRADGLPVGVQALGLRFDDLTFLDILAALEAALIEED
jgi:Asp-tRNA(Asn)/Glu-tRNA(Gln) amidotransferase A subunit family amidase